MFLNFSSFSFPPTVLFSVLLRTTEKFLNRTRDMNTFDLLKSCSHRSGGHCESPDLILVAPHSYEPPAVTIRCFSPCS